MERFLRILDDGSGRLRSEDAKVRLCLRAAGELEKRKQDNQKKIQAKMVDIEKNLDALKKYRTTSEDDGVGYYDAFKLQKKEEDFKANVKRLELAAIWDEIVEMLRLRQLPDEFEIDKEWVDLGTRFRGLVEPLDIANFYRHSRTDDAGHYMKEGNRPSRYKFSQRWQEHKYQLPPMQQSQQSLKHFYGETSFWAKVEELKTKPWEAIKDEVLVLGNRLKEWYKNDEVEDDVFLQKSTLVEWWQKLCEDHLSCAAFFRHQLSSETCIAISQSSEIPSVFVQYICLICLFIGFLRGHSLIKCPPFNPRSLTVIQVT
ncbi:hypothetical protein EUGRSUZ_L03388 [Eucalyptus grandis]|uniref:EDS1 EP domain-containing protein n=1 Tax=Eucalyptus grandis TaxID=71139 RepID=A0AAD9T8F9_EUCGR|nr:hypothetical protein EUGRSUZ_L03388 [Eucalyptus grandis]